LFHGQIEEKPFEVYFTISLCGVFMFTTRCGCADGGKAAVPNFISAAIGALFAFLRLRKHSKSRCNSGRKAVLYSLQTATSQALENLSLQDYYYWVSTLRLWAV